MAITISITIPRNAGVSRSARRHAPADFSGRLRVPRPPYSPVPAGGKRRASIPRRTGRTDCSFRSESRKAYRLRQDWSTVYLRRTAAGTCHGSVVRTRARKRRSDHFFIAWDTASGCTGRICRASLASCFRSTVLSYSYTDVSGTAIPGALLPTLRRPVSLSGRTSSARTSTGIVTMSPGSVLRAGACLSCGNVRRPISPRLQLLCDHSSPAGRRGGRRYVETDGSHAQSELGRAQ